MLIGEKIPILNISKENENLFKKDIVEYLKNEKILYFKSAIITKINQYYLIHKSLLIVNPNLNINKIKFQFQLSHNSSYNTKIKDKLEKINNILIIFKTFKHNILSIYRQIKNETFINNFVLFLNDNEIYYTVEQKMINSNKNIFYKEEYQYDEEDHTIKDIIGLINIGPFSYDEFKEKKNIDLDKENWKEIEIFNFD